MASTAAASSVESCKRSGVGLPRRVIWFDSEARIGSVGVEDPGADKVVLDRLSGREKLKEGRGRWFVPVPDVSELKDGDRGCGRAGNVDMGEYGNDTALPSDSLRGLENVDPPLELLYSSSELSWCVTLALLDGRVRGDTGGAKVRGMCSREVDESIDEPCGSATATTTGAPSAPLGRDVKSSGDSVRGISCASPLILGVAVRGVTLSLSS